jgi:hypothetical protein
MSSRRLQLREALLALFLLTSNEHILDKVMVKNRGLNHLSYKDVSPVTHLLTCSLF